MGEISSALSFHLARQVGKSPKEIAEKIAEQIKSSEMILSAEAVNGYVNFFTNPGGYAKLVLEAAVSDEEYGFLKTVKPERMMFTLGSKIPVNLYIENKGSYTDVYDVDYEIDPFISSVVKVDMTGASSTGSVAHGEFKRLYPRIMILDTHATGYVDFNVISQGDPTLSKTTRLQIIESDFPLSLPEFGIFGLIGMIILAGIVYSSCIKRPT
jgi:hypothetical protein